MKERILCSVIVAVLVLLCVYWLAPNIAGIPDYYSKNIRASLFTGFLTVGSFLLSLQAFIVVKLKENVFDSPLYRERVASRKKLDPRITLYGPVKRLSSMLFLSTASAIFASVCQLTFGLIQELYATFICIFAASFAISMLVAALLLIRSALQDWLDTLEDHNNLLSQQEKG